MIVSFLHVGDDTALPEKMIASVRRSMPGVRIVQMTDNKSPHLVDEVQVLPYDGERLMTYRLHHLAARNEPMLILDTDVIVQRDLSDVFLKKFDIALTRRTKPLLYQGKNITPIMPYNTGVMFSRCRAFWEEAHETCRSAPENIQRWWGDQLAVRLTADTGKYKLLELPVDKYNYSPKSEDEDVSHRHVVHYKGPERKEWMTRVP